MLWAQVVVNYPVGVSNMPAVVALELPLFVLESCLEVMKCAEKNYPSYILFELGYKDAKL